MRIESLQRLAATALLVAACSPDGKPLPDGKSATRSASAASRPFHGSRYQTGPTPLITPAAGALSYYGGPIMSSAWVLNVDWNTSVVPRIHDNMTPFYNALGTSDLWSFLAGEYGTRRNANAGSDSGSPGTQQDLAFSSATDTYPLNQVTSGYLADSDVQNALRAGIASGVLPAPTADSIYMVNMPPGSFLTDPNGYPSCVAGGFCAYHYAFSYGSTYAKYAVIMDTSSDCAVGCGTDSDYLNNATSNASHELVESVTDPLGVFAVDYPAAWTSPGGEIGDYCAKQHGILKARKPDGTHWVAQREYDNVNGGCVAPCTPITCASVGANCGSIDDQCGGTLDCGSCPNGETCGVPSVNPNYCCRPLTTCDGTWCGTKSDGCGGTISCGCGAGQQCGPGGFCIGAPPPPPPQCVASQCMQGCLDCNGSAGHCVSGACVCASKRACM
jgi:hypothetical protein